MKKLFSTLLLLVLVLDAHAATIIGDMRSVLGEDASNTVVNVSSLDTPVAFNGHTYLSFTTSTRLTNGQLNVTIPPPGRANISFFGKNTSLRVAVPANTNTYDISQMLTNVLVLVNQGISKYILPGTGFVCVTNNPGLANETLTITSIGGVASNAFQTQISGPGISLSTDSLNYLYTLALNANLQSWSGLATAAKQDALGYVPQPASANGSNWAALATSAKQDALGYTPATTNFATTSVPGLAFPDGVTIVIDPTTHKWSSVATGTGDVVGPGSATSGHVATYSSGTGKALGDSGHALSEYTPLTQTASGSQNGLLISSDWTAFNAKPTTNTSVLTNDARNVTFGGTFTNKGGVVLPAALAGDTNAAITASNAVQKIFDNTIDLLNLTNTSTTLFGVSTDGYPVRVTLSTGLTLAHSDKTNATLSASGGIGGSASPMVCSNILIQVTNEIVWDIQHVQHLTLQFNTNLNRLTISNAWAITNAPSGIVQLDTWEDTNGTWRVLSTNVVGGLMRTFSGWIRGTNASQYDMLSLRLDGTLTNVLADWKTNAQPVEIFTNTLTTGGGGGGGGSGFTLVDHTAQGGSSGDTTSPTINSTGANLLVAVVSYTSGSTPSLTDSKGNTWTEIHTTATAGKLSMFYVISPSVGSGHTVTTGTVGACNVVFLAFTKAGGTPSLDSASTGFHELDWLSKTVQPGSITPSGANDLFVCGLSFNIGNGSGHAVDSSFTTIHTPIDNGGTVKQDTAYKLKSSSSTAENPGWTDSNAVDSDAWSFQLAFQ